MIYLLGSKQKLSPDHHTILLDLRPGKRALRINQVTFLSPDRRPGPAVPIRLIRSDADQPIAAVPFDAKAIPATFGASGGACGVTQFDWSPGAWKQTWHGSVQPSPFGDAVPGPLQNFDISQSLLIADPSKATEIEISAVVQESAVEIYSVRSTIRGEKAIDIGPDDSGTGKIFGFAVDSTTTNGVPVTVALWRMQNGLRAGKVLEHPWNPRSPYSHDFDIGPIVTRHASTAQIVFSAATPEPIEFRLMVGGESLRVEEVP